MASYWPLAGALSALALLSSAALANPTPQKATVFYNVFVGDRVLDADNIPVYTTNARSDADYVSNNMEAPVGTRLLTLGAATGASTTSYNPIPSVYSTASGLGGGTFTNARASSSIVYQFMVDCGICGVGTTKNLDITATVEAMMMIPGGAPNIIPTNVPAGGFATARVSLAQNGGGVLPTILDQIAISLAGGVVNKTDSSGSTSFGAAYDGTNFTVTNDTTTVAVVVNELYSITIETAVGAGQNTTASAFADPTIAFSAGQTLESGIQLLFSAVPDEIPEPASILLLGLGIAGLAGQRRRKIA